MKTGIIGLGLMGGSIARSIRRVYPDSRIIAYNRTQEVLNEAMRKGIIDEAAWDITAAFGDCDYIFLCVPVITMRSFLKKLKGVIGFNTIITDVGSTKKGIHECVKELGLSRTYIGGHPMAGSEKIGYMNSSDSLFENAWYILTPGEEVPIETVSAFSEFIRSLGALPLILSDEEHDYITAAISHVPHVISASLVNAVHELDSEKGYMRAIAAGGFKDLTRISSSSPQIWQEICLANSENICTVLETFIRKLVDFRFAIRNEDSNKLLKYFTDSRNFRESFTDEAVGPFKKYYRLYVDVKDEAGAIAGIAAVLADEKISMRNIGIINNRDFEKGVLKIEFYDEETLLRAEKALDARKYRVYRDW
ncbi:MAG: prephenate dehydrogenase/arogenate dehydrogenase family protein [Lachnospiraceae bacterium]|nr:prephenate dehydrogenase/arogenate dehydrogenase family protein [Lachnospiraceae bacterium]